MSSPDPQAIENDDTPVQTILIVEDDEEIGTFLTEAIKQVTRYQPLSVTTATQALEAVCCVIPSLFLIDYHLPDLTGLELVDRLHAIEGVAAVPMLLMSASPPTRQALRQRGLSLIKKPFDLHTLLQTMKRLLAPGA